MKKMFICPKCKQAYSSENPNLCCSDCGGSLMPMPISVESWRKLSQQQKAEYKSSLLEKNNAIVSEFFQKCLEEFHQEAQKRALAGKGLINISELEPIGQKYVFSLINNNIYKVIYATNYIMFYRMAIPMCIAAGIDCATVWHQNPAGLNDYVNSITDDVSKAENDVNEIITKYLPSISQDQEKAFYEQIVNLWLKLIEPYSNTSNLKELCFYAAVAGYRLGISIILDKIRD